MVGGGVGALLEFMFYLSPYVLSWDSSRGFAGVDDTLLSHPFHILLEYTAHPRSSPSVLIAPHHGHPRPPAPHR
jgi:hypothetical protein